MNLKSFLKNFVVPAAVLTIICVVVSAALVLTYDTTKPIIEATKIAAADKARAVVLAGAKDFALQSVNVEDVVEVYKAGNDVGYVITAKSKGYGGDMYVMVGIKNDGTIDSVKLMDNNETPGQGSKTGEEKYTNQYKGKTGNDVDAVEAISGATVSSFAFRNAVKQAFLAYGELAGVTFEEPKAPEFMVFPDVEAFEEITVEGAIKALKAGDKGVIIVTEAQGYSDAPIKMQVYTGFGPDGKIVGVYLGENKETMGVGSQVNEESYRSQYVGKDNADKIEAISGATESSEGFQIAVKKAVELYKTMNASAS
ncbi:MAG: FMN-binding protein [Angelakisella sp.]